MIHCVSTVPITTVSSLHAPVRPIQPPRRARSDVGDSRAIDSAHGGSIASQSGGGRRRRSDEPPPGNGNADSPPPGQGNNLLSEESFYRVAVEKIMERERLGAGSGDGHGDNGHASGSGGGDKRGGSRGCRTRRTYDEARKGGVADSMGFASLRGAVAGRPGRRKVNHGATLCRHGSKTSLKHVSSVTYTTHVREGPSLGESCRKEFECDLFF